MLKNTMTTDKLKVYTVYRPKTETGRHTFLTTCFCLSRSLTPYQNSLIRLLHNKKESSGFASTMQETNQLYTLKIILFSELKQSIPYRFHRSFPTEESTENEDIYMHLADLIE